MSARDRTLVGSHALDLFDVHLYMLGSLGGESGPDLQAASGSRRLHIGILQRLLSDFAKAYLGETGCRYEGLGAGSMPGG